GALAESFRRAALRGVERAGGDSVGRSGFERTAPRGDPGAADQRRTALEGDAVPRGSGAIACADAGSAFRGNDERTCEPLGPGASFPAGAARRVRSIDGAISSARAGLLTLV